MFDRKIKGGVVICRHNLTIREFLTLVAFKAIPDNVNAVDSFISISSVPKICHVLSVNILPKA